MLFDALDGSAARLTNQTSDFGAQLDSLCDAISFGVAPAFIMLQLVHPEHHLMDTILVAPFNYLPEVLLEILPRILWAIAVLFMWCALLDLVDSMSRPTKTIRMISSVGYRHRQQPVLSRRFRSQCK